MSRGPLPPITLRGVVDDDVRFITSSWLESYRTAGAAVRHVVNDVYYTSHHRLIERMWHDDRVLKLVAAFPEDTAFIYGWVFAEVTNVGPVIHYVYVRQRWRGHGVASALLDTVRWNGEDYEPQGFISHHTPAWEALEHGQRAHPFRTTYSPYMAFAEYQFPSKVTT